MSKEARNSVCPECGSYRVTYEHTDDYDWELCTCGCCGCSGTPDEFFHNSVFARITASPEVLAKELVTTSYDEFKDCTVYWAWLGNGRREAYYSESEAVAATVARLKEVCNG